MFQLFVEGQGEKEAAQKLVHKILGHCSLGKYYFSEGRRIPNLHTDDGLRRAVAYARLDPRTEGVLILRDDEDYCPKELAPQKATMLRSLQAPFPVGYCIMYREFESLFVAYASEFSGKEIPHLIRGTIQFKDDIPIVAPETIRDAKKWIAQYTANGYKPTTDQLSLTQAMDIGLLAQKGLPCFETLYRCLRQIIAYRGNHLYTLFKVCRDKRYPTSSPAALSPAGPYCAAAPARSE